MAKRNISHITDQYNILREISKQVTAFDESLHTLLNDLIETMQAVNGVGIAAPQVGILKRVFIIENPENEGVIEFVNPVIVKSSGNKTEVEGCLSVPKQTGYVNRPKKVEVKAQDRFGNEFIYKTVDPLTCSAICHETDHLNGVLFIDKLVEEPVKK